MSSQLEDVIAKLVTRLETVTSRLEKVEKQIQAGGLGSNVGGTGASSNASTSDGEQAAFVSAFDDLIQTHIAGTFVSACNTLGGDLPELAQLVLKALEEQKKLLVVASKSKKPSDADFAKLVGGLVAASQAISAYKDSKNRTTKMPNHLSTVTEGVGALNWVAISPTPAPFIGDMIGSSEFYSNRILKEFKGKDDNQVSFVTGFNTFLKELQKYVKQYHTTGLAWNPKGGDALSAQQDAPGAGAPPPPAGGPPPPGPPPPASSSSSSSSSDDSSAAASAVFAQINSGNVTAGLRKVTKDMKTKNRTDNTGRVGDVPKKAAAPAKPASKVVKKGPAKTELLGNKWSVENHDGGEHIVDASDFKQTVYIYKVDNSVVKINNKINAITIDGCKKTAVVFETAIASLEIVNCNSIKVQILNKVPSITVDKTSGCQLFLAKECLDAEIVTSKTDEMNLVIPGKTEDDDPIELPVPEQFLTKVQNYALHTVSVKHTGV